VYWSFMEMRGTCAELSKLALVLLACKPQTASAERLFREYAAQQTRARNRMSPATLNKLASVKSTWDQRGHVLGGPSCRSTNRVMEPQERASVVPAAQRDVADGGHPAQHDEYDEVDSGITATSGAASATLQQWVDAVDVLTEACGLVAEDRRGAPPMFLALTSLHKRCPRLRSHCHCGTCRGTRRRS